MRLNPKPEGRSARKKYEDRNPNPIRGVAIGFGFRPKGFIALYGADFPSLLKPNGVVHLGALGAAGAVDIGVVGVDVTTATAAKDPIFAGGWFKATPAKFRVNGGSGQGCQQRHNVS